MHRPLLYVAVLLLAVSSVAVAGLSASFDEAPVSQAATSHGVSTVRRYYEAANELIATGDPAGLRQVLHPAMSDQNPPAPGPDGIVGIEGYLHYLHTIDPRIRLEPIAVVDHGQQIVAEVAVKAAPVSLPLGFVVHDPSSIWPNMEVFRVRDRQIVERRSPALWIPQVTPVYAADSSAEGELPASHRLDVTTFRFGAYARVRLVTGAMPAFLFAQTGTLVLSLKVGSPEPAMIVNASDGSETGRSRHVLPGKTGRVKQGDLLTIPAHAEISLLNLWQAPATMVALSTPIKAGVVPAMSDEDRLLGFGFTSAALWSASLDHLDQGTAGYPRVSVGTVSLSPRGSLRVASSTSLMMIWALGEQVPISDSDSVCSLTEPHSQATQMASDAPVRLRLLCPDAAEEGGYVVNPGVEPVTVWVLAVTSSPAGVTPSGS
jgi:hypothetical protein